MYKFIVRVFVIDPTSIDSKIRFQHYVEDHQNDLLLYILGLGILILIFHYDNKTIPTMYDFHNSTNIHGQKQVSRIVKIVLSGPHF